MLCLQTLFLFWYWSHLLDQETMRSMYKREKTGGYTKSESNVSN